MSRRGIFSKTHLSLSLPPFVSRRGHSNTNQRLSQPAMQESGCNAAAIEGPGTTKRMDQSGDCFLHTVTQCNIHH